MGNFHNAKILHWEIFYHTRRSVYEILSHKQILREEFFGVFLINQTGPEGLSLLRPAPAFFSPPSSVLYPVH